MAFLGSSGAGKSTQSIALLGRDLLDVGAVRTADGKEPPYDGVAQLIEMPGGALLIDTPGMRSLQPWADVNQQSSGRSRTSPLARRNAASPTAHMQNEPDARSWKPSRRGNSSTGSARALSPASTLARRAPMNQKRQRRRREAKASGSKMHQAQKGKCIAGVEESSSFWETPGP